MWVWMCGVGGGGGGGGRVSSNALLGAVKVGGLWWTRHLGTACLPINMPALSPTMSAGNLVEWAVQEGQKVSMGDNLASIETDKATLDFESPEDGFIAKLLVPGGATDVPVGKVVALLVDSEGDLGKDDYEYEDATSVESSSPVATSAEPATGTSGSKTSDSTASSSAPAKYVSPAAKSLASLQKVDPSQIPATGPRNTLTKGDVLTFLKQHPTASTPPPPRAAGSTPRAPQNSKPPTAQRAAAPATVDPVARFKDVPTSTMRKVIANRLTESKETTPHSYLLKSICLDRLSDVRSLLKKNLGVSVTVNDFLVKACAICVAEIEPFRRQLDSKTGEYKVQPNADISVAVATEKGLLTPIVFQANTLTLSAISADVKDKAVRARAGKLLPQEYTGGVFSISNLGMTEISNFTAIINPPQVAILAIGKGRQIPVLDPNNGMSTRTMMDVHLCCDLRAVSLQDASAFLNRLQQLLEEPTLMI